MKRIFVGAIVILFLLISGKAGASPVTPIIYLSEESYIADAFSTSPALNFQYFMDPYLNKNAFSEHAEGQTVTAADSAVSQLMTFSEDFIIKTTDLPAHTLTGTSLIVDHLFPSPVPEDVYVKREIFSLRSYLAGNGTVNFSDHTNDALFIQANQNRDKHQVVAGAGLTPGGEAIITENQPEHPAATENRTLAAAIEAQTTAPTETQPPLSEVQPIVEVPIQVDGSMSTSDMQDEPKNSLPEPAEAGSQIAEKKAKLPASDMPAPDHPDPAAVAPFIAAWQKAWEQKDVPAYLSLYSEDFLTPGGISLQSWKKKRQQRLGKPQYINIEIRDMQIQEISNARTRVTFIQEYQSDTYSDRVVKTLELAWENGAWNIAAENSRRLD